MKKTILLSILGFLYAFMFSSCDKEDEITQRDEEAIEIKTRASENYYVTSFTGETNLIVGKRYTYVVDLERSLHTSAPITITSNNRNAIRIAYGDSYYPERTFTMGMGQYRITFSVLVIGEANNLQFFVNSGGSNVFIVGGKLSGISAKFGSYSVTSPAHVLPGADFEISTTFPFDKPANMALGVDWSYTPFVFLRDGFNGPLKFSKTFKAPTEPGSYNVKINIYGQSGAVSKFSIGSITQQIDVFDPEYCLQFLGPRYGAAIEKVREFKLVYISALSLLDAKWYINDELVLSNEPILRCIINKPGFHKIRCVGNLKYNDLIIPFDCVRPYSVND